MAARRFPCPSCGRLVALTSKRRMWTHGRPECPQSRRRPSRLWPDELNGRPVKTVPGPDTWNPTTLEGAA